MRVRLPPPAPVGFLVAYLPSNTGPLFAMTIVPSILLAIGIRMAFVKRNRLTKRSRDIRLKVTEILPKELSHSRTD